MGKGPKFCIKKILNENNIFWVSQTMLEITDTSRSFAHLLLLFSSSQRNGLNWMEALVDVARVDLGGKLGLVCSKFWGKDLGKRSVGKLELVCSKVEACCRASCPGWGEAWLNLTTGENLGKALSNFGFSLKNDMSIQLWAKCLQFIHV